MCIHIKLYTWIHTSMPILGGLGIPFTQQQKTERAVATHRHNLNPKP